MNLSASSLACPVCHGVLLREKPAWHCQVCDKGYPDLNGIPWLYQDPETEWVHWQNLYHHMISTLDAEAEDAKLSLKEAAHQKTKDRLGRIIQGKKEQIQCLQKILSPLGLPDKPDLPLHLAMRSQLPKAQGFLSYYDNIFRDWCWGEEENRRSMEILEQLGKGLEASGPALVMGAGSCRLAWDIALRAQSAEVYAMDINPLMLLAAKRLFDGRRVQLVEFPIAPLSMKDFAVKQSMKLHAKAPEHLQLIFGDALKPPFVPGTLAKVVTPWVIDILQADLPVLMASVNRSLQMEGVWLNFGSLAFFHSDFGKCYSVEEVEDLLAEWGFALLERGRFELPYLNSPLSSQKRFESVYGFAAKKIAHCTSQAPASHKPGWLTDHSIPIPLLPAFQRLVAANQLFVHMIGLIDGRQSIATLAEKVAPTVGVSPQAAQALIEQVLFDLVQKTSKSSAFS